MASLNSRLHQAPKDYKANYRVDCRPKGVHMLLCQDKRL